MKKSKHINKFDNQLPKIEVKPNTGNNKTSHIPHIIFTGKIRLTNSDRAKLIQLISFIDRNDLIGLKNIRIVSELKSMYGGDAVGCYHAKNRNNEAEILLSDDLFSLKSTITNIFLKLFYSNRLLETLYHEVGHHKAAMTHSVSKYKGEAFAEKYMNAYRKAWFKEYGPKRFSVLISKILMKPIIFIVKWIAYLFRGKYPFANLVYRYYNREITRDEYSAKAQLIANEKEKKSKSNKLHPLQETKYRKKFKIKNIQ